MTESLRIDCPNCGVSQRVPLDKIPEQGAWGRCASCRHRVFIERPGAPAPTAAPVLSEDTWSPDSGEQVPLERDRPKKTGTSTVYLKTPEGQTISITYQQLEERVRSERVLPWDLISEDGRRFEPIQKNPDFVESFQGFYLTLHKNCWNHTGKVSEKICVRCQRCYCEECIPAPAKPGVTTRTCWACGGILQDTDPGWRFDPYWKRLREVIQFPKGKLALLATAGLALLLWAASLSAVTLPLYLVGSLFLMYVLERSAKGGKSLQQALQVVPGPAEIRDIAERGLLASIIIFVVVVPLILVNIFLPLSLALILTFFIFLAAFWYHLMAIAVAMLSEKPFAAFQPKVVIRQIQAMGQDYLSLLLGLLLVYISFVINHFVVSSVPVVGIPLTKLIVAYGSIVSAHVVGWTYYLNLGRLGWRRPSMV